MHATDLKLTPEEVEAIGTPEAAILQPSGRREDAPAPSGRAFLEAAGVCPWAGRGYLQN